MENPTLLTQQLHPGAAEHPEAMEYELDWNNAAKVVLALVMSQTPGVGPGLAAIVNIFWPSEKEDVWAKIRKQVEALIDQKLAEFAYKDVKASLDGKRDLVSRFLEAVDQKSAEIALKWSEAEARFVHDFSLFTLPDYDLVLLPLFAQFANLHLLLLREAVRVKGDWGWNEVDQKIRRETLKKTIVKYSEYVEKTFAKSLEKRRGFLAKNKLTRDLTFTVLDFKTLWKYADIDAYPKPVKALLDREIYSDPIGLGENVAPIVLPSPPKGFPMWLSVWIGRDSKLVNSVQLTYGDGMGPDGVTVTPDSGGKNRLNPPWRNPSNMATQPVVRVTGWHGTYTINCLEFHYKYSDRDGGTSKAIGRCNIPKARRFPLDLKYEGHLMSSIWMQAHPRKLEISDDPDSPGTLHNDADTVVFGFKMDPLWKPKEADMRPLFLGASNPMELREALREEWTAEEHPVTWLTAEPDWDEERRAFWSSIRSYAAQAKV
jgi:delta endotoxin-like protein